MDNLDALVQGTYTGQIGFTLDGQPVSAYYVEPGGPGDTGRYELSARGVLGTTSWSLEWGSYTGDVHGYWIKQTSDICGYYAWQPNGYINTVHYWNEDCSASSNPEDLEMWYFEIVDHDNRLIRIRNRDVGYVFTDPNKTLFVGVQQDAAQVFKVVLF
ncbi:hypothetical protein [Terracidiphilus sp.]|uniref:hypothetical protein n=1 Tax=Terracidiphilus sp. TaxID=1964191 RepID=UPI003C15FD7F